MVNLQKFLHIVGYFLLLLATWWLGVFIAVIVFGSGTQLKLLILAVVALFFGFWLKDIKLENYEEPF